MARPQRTSRLKWTDWLLVGIPLTVAGILIFIVVAVLNWQTRPASPWGQALADVFFENPYLALALIAAGIIGIGKAIVEYNRQ